MRASGQPAGPLLGSAHVSWPPALQPPPSSNPAQHITGISAPVIPRHARIGARAEKAVGGGGGGGGRTLFISFFFSSGRATKVDSQPYPRCLYELAALTSSSKATHESRGVRPVCLGLKGEEEGGWEPGLFNKNSPGCVAAMIRHDASVDGSFIQVTDERISLPRPLVTYRDF
ncbi:hypothetical protein BX600DRAFT_430682 [Xylariales sp. PMI_506]|nr:hypothetical protein BX600DRAFT_430682 [Xylariales sp. PMI_506]